MRKVRVSSRFFPAFLSNYLSSAAINKSKQTINKQTTSSLKAGSKIFKFYAKIMAEESKEQLSDFQIVKLEKSQFLKPLRLQFTLNGRRKNWDFLQVHNSVSVLIYNTTRKVIVLVKQFRPSMYAAQIPGLTEGSTIDCDKYPVSEGYSLELCAGIVDKDLSLKGVAREEVLEECGYDVPVDSLRHIFTLRNVGVTGNTSSLFYLEVEDKQKVTGGGGLHSEGEFIETVEMTVPEFKKYLYSVDLKSPGGFVSAGLWFLANVDA